MEGNGLKSPAFAALALAFASFGDAFLYPFLPVNHLAVGIPVMWIGILLSINRFVRILSNGLMVHLFARHGLRTIMIVAVVLAIASTIGYAFAGSVILWLLLRVAWGFSFSAMRIGTLGYALRHPKQGISLGVSRSLQEVGPMLALIGAPLLLQTFEVTSIFILLSLCSLPAFYFAMNLPRTNDRTPAVSSKLFVSFPSTFNAITLIFAILIDGIVVVVLGVLFLKYGESITPIIATALAAFYLGYRRVCLVVLSPVGGWLADRIGLDKVFNLSVILILVGLVLLAFGWIASGTTIIFTFYSVNVAITPGSISQGQTHSLAAVAENATWRDIGAAIGTLLGGFLITSSYLNLTLIFFIFSLLVLFLTHMGRAQKAFKFLYLWK
jgi:MFS family permease